MSFISNIEMLASFALAFWLLLAFGLLREVGKYLATSVRALAYAGSVAIPVVSLGTWSLVASFTGVVLFIVIGLALFLVYDTQKRSNEGHTSPWWFRVL